MVRCLFLALVLSVWPVLAQDCHSPSPSNQAGVGRFEALPIASLTPAQKATLDSFLSNLSGEYAGRGWAFACIGRFGEATAEEVSLEVEFRAKEVRQGLDIKADIHDLDEKTYRTDDLSLYLVEDSLRLGTDSKASLVQVLAVSADRLVLLQKTSSYSGARLAREVLLTLELQGEQLTVQRTTYTNGFLDGSALWTLVR